MKLWFRVEISTVDVVLEKLEVLVTNVAVAGVLDVVFNVADV